MQMKIWCK